MYTFFFPFIFANDFRTGRAFVWGHLRLCRCHWKAQKDVVTMKKRKKKICMYENVFHVLALVQSYIQRRQIQSRLTIMEKMRWREERNARACISHEIETNWTWKNYKFSEIIKLYENFAYVSLWNRNNRRVFDGKFESFVRKISFECILRNYMQATQEKRFLENGLCHRSKMSWNEK